MFYDVTRPMHPGMPVFPGDPEVSFNRVLDIARDGVSLHSITMGTHTGTHVDAPFHYIRDGNTVDGIDPAILVGEALLCDLQDTPEIRMDHLPVLEKSRRVVFKTGYRPEKGFSDYTFLTPGAARYLVDKGILLVGLDSPSPDPPGSSESHGILLNAGVVIVENLYLDNVPAGLYRMYCLPLLLCGMDGAPARVLLKGL
ncbi:MAG: cyclase family protein [Bacillota bacterium]